MKKSLKCALTVFLAAVIVAGAVVCGVIYGNNLKAEAATTYTDGYYTYTVTDGEATISDCDTSISGDVTIPSTLGGYDVKKIGSRSFQSCVGLTSITIPDSVVTIGVYAFFGCRSLESVTIGNSVTTIGVDAFCGCKGLANIIIPDSVTSIGDSAFSSCTSLTSITIPENVTYIGCSAFYNCTGLTTVNYNAVNCQTMGLSENVVFENCSNLKTINIGKTVKTIPPIAFFGCSSLNEVMISDSVTTVGVNAFGDCINLESFVVDKENLFFENDENGVLFTINKAREKVELVAYPCGREGSYIIPEGIKSIGSYAFYNCAVLTDITIPASIISVGDAAFDCVLGNAYYPGSKEQWEKVECANYNETLTANLIFECYSERPYYDCGTCGDNLTWKFFTDGELLIEGTGDMDHYYIKHDRYDIGGHNPSPWYDYNGRIKTVTISENVGKITYYAFYKMDFDTLNYNARNCEFEELGDNFRYLNITYIIDNATAFMVCKFKNINVGETVDVVPENAFTTSIAPLRSSVTTVTISDGVEKVESKAFANRTGITTLTVEGTETKFAEDAFKGCANIDTVYFVGNQEQCSFKALFPDTIFVYECYSERPYYFYGKCGDNLYHQLFTDGELIITGSGDMYNKDSSAFSKYGNFVKTITISNKATGIGDYAFYGLGYLTNVKMGDGIRTIGEKAFANCTEIKTITIPDEVSSIGYLAFAGCSKLETVNYNATNCTKASTTYSSGRLVPIFDGCTNLKIINIGKNVKILPDEVFYGCKGVTGITIPDNVTTIGRLAFYNCIGLKSIVIPDSVTSIGSSAFSGCTSLETAIIGKGTTAISSSLFENCTALKSVTLPEGLKTIRSDVFSNCSKLSCVHIPESVTYIYDSAFNNCVALTSITIPENVTYIGDSAFYNCTGLTTVNYNAAKCATMGSSAKVVFENCSNLRTINIGKTVKSIPDYAFAWYLPVESVAIPDNVTNIGSYAFAFCENIKNVIIPDSVTAIGAYAFGYCYGMEYIHIPASITAIGENLLKNTEAYICSDTLDCYAKIYSAENGIAFMLCDSHETPHFHSYTSSATTASTCTTPGVTVNTCSCGNSYQDGVPALGHKSGEWQTVTEATEESEGKKIKVCVTCGETVEEKILPVILIKTAVDNKFGIALEYNANSFNGAVAVLASKTENETITGLVKETTGVGEMQVHNVAMTVEGVVTQPEESVTLRIPLPEGYDAEKSSVYSVNPETGAVEEIAAEYENGYFVFETVDVGYFAIVEKTSSGDTGDTGNEGGETPDPDVGRVASISLRKPTVTTVNYGDTLILHANVSTLPEGCSIKWTVEGTGVTLSPSADGMTCAVTCTGSGAIRVKATVVDENGNAMYDADGQEASAAQNLTAKAGFFQKLISFFKNLFGVNRVIAQTFKNIF